MAFSLEMQIQLLTLGNELKMSVNWENYRQDAEKGFLFEVVVSNSSDKICSSWLSMDDLMPYVRAYSGTPVNGEVVFKPQSTLSPDAVKMLWNQIEKADSRHISTATGKVLTPKGTKYPVTANGDELDNLDYGYYSQHSSHHPFAQGTTSEVNRKAASSSGTGKQLGQQDSNNILSHDKLDKKRPLLAPASFLPPSKYHFVSDVRATKKDGVTALRVPMKSKSSKQKKKKYICEICGWSENYQRKMDRHYLMHERKGNGKKF